MYAAEADGTGEPLLDRDRRKVQQLTDTYGERIGGLEQQLEDLNRAVPDPGQRQ